MKKIIALGATALLFGALLLPTTAGAAPPNPGTNWGKYVNPSSCSGKLVINITYDVVNDADSGVAGNYWAYDDYRREIQVWQGADGAFCAVARYEGQFTTVATTSPSGTGTVSDGQRGTMVGGYKATFSGTLSLDPAYPQSGYIGSFDFGWTGNTGSPAPSPFSWLGAYFSFVDWSTWDQPFWGWVYRGGACGTWYNTNLGNSGNIAC